MHEEQKAEILKLREANSLFITGSEDVEMWSLTEQIADEFNHHEAQGGSSLRDMNADSDAFRGKSTPAAMVRFQDNWSCKAVLNYRP